VLDSLRRNNLCHWSMECYYGLIFSLQNPSTSGMVLEDFDTSFSDKFYHSHLDDMCELIYFLGAPPPPPKNLRFRPRLFFVFTDGKFFCKNLIFFCFKLFFWVFLNCFDVPMSGINYKKWKKHYFDAFPSEKHFEKQPLPRCQTGSYPKLYIITYLIDILKKKFGWFTVLYLECSKYKFFSHSGSCFSCCPHTLYPCKWWQKFKQHSSWCHQCQCLSSWRTDELPIGLWTRIVLWVGEKLYSTNQSMPKPLCWSYPWGTFVKSLSWICWWCFQVYMEFSSW